MNAQGTNLSLSADAVKAHVLRLAPLLIRGGLGVTTRPGGIVEIKNPQGATSADPVSRALNPGMTQLVALRDWGGEPWWFWVWSGPTRDAPPEYEAMVPADHPDEAARRIGNVLHVQPPAAER